MNYLDPVDFVHYMELPLYQGYYGGYFPPPPDVTLGSGDDLVLGSGDNLTLGSN